MRPEVETITKIYSLKYARVNSSPINTASANSKAGSSLVDAVQALLSSNGKLNEDSRTNSLIITDVSFQFGLIEETIKKLDVPVPKVIIEAEIIDTSKTLTDKLGMAWTDSGLYTLTLASRTGLAFPFQSWLSRDAQTQITTGSINAASNTAVLYLLKQDVSTKVLARPKILTMSNESAEIKITGNEAIGTITTFDDQGLPQTTSAERYEVGVTLKVTPSVNMDTGEITMVLEPNVSSVKASAQGVGNYYDPQQRSAKVTISVKDNETVVIGGLLKKDVSDTKRKVPLLGDIPFLGSLFRYKYTTDQDRELLVFITPRIVPSDGVGLAKLEQLEKYDKEILTQREQANYQNRKQEIDKVLEVWDNK